MTDTPKVAPALNRRNFLTSALAAPWVVRSGVLMPVRRIVAPALITSLNLATSDPSSLCWEWRLNGVLIGEGPIAPALGVDAIGDVLTVRAFRAPGLATRV